MQKELVAAVAILMAGCATKPQYSHSTITDPDQAARQMVIDDGACTAAAAQVQVPQIANVPKSTSTGTITASSGKTYEYTARSGSSFSSGFANGMNMRAASDAKAAQQKIYNGCMVAKGWTLK